MIVETYRQYNKMRAKDFKVNHGILQEVNMRPVALEAAAEALPGAMVGIEFEMYVPDVVDSPSDNNVQADNDWSNDPRIETLTQIFQFYAVDAVNSRSSVTHMVDEIRIEYREWLESLWQKEGFSYLYEIYLQPEYDRFMASAERQINAEFHPLPGESPAERKQRYENEVQDTAQNEYAHYAQTVWAEARTASSSAVKVDWLNTHGYSLSFYLRYKHGIIRMSNLLDEYASYHAVEWPYKQEQSTATRTIDEIALQFMTDMGHSSVAYTNLTKSGYKKWVNDEWQDIGSNKPSDCFTIEPDASLKKKQEATDGGLEFVSPPLPLKDMYTTLTRVREWAIANKCYANRSVGLHVNVSLPGLNSIKTDYLKLVLLLGDEHVLRQFKRSASDIAADEKNYAVSGISRIVQSVKNSPHIVPGMLDSMREKLSHLATKAIIGNVDKYTSVHTKNEYIEFRGPGGDWINANYDLLLQTLHRFVVATAAAMDPDMYREDYLKKLYKLFQPYTAEETDITKAFVLFSAGEIDAESLKKRLLKNNQGKTAQNAIGGRWWWKLTYRSSSIELVASGEASAIEQAKQHWRMPNIPSREISAERIKRYDEGSEKLFIIYPKNNLKKKIYVRASNIGDVLPTAARELPQFRTLALNQVEIRAV